MSAWYAMAIPSIDRVLERRPLRFPSSSNCYQTIRGLHLYVGLLVSPLVLIFAASVIVINHWHPVTGRGAAATEETRQIEYVPDSFESLDAVYSIMEQAHLSGWVTFFTHLEEQNQYRFIVLRPTVRRDVVVDLETKTLQIRHRPNDLKTTLVWLHVFPGPHTQYKNWFFTFLWWILADGVAFGVIFLSVTGIYLWIFLKVERKIGLLSITLGMVSFALILIPLFP